MFSHRFALLFKRRLVERLTHLSVAPEEQARQRAISHALLRNTEVRLANVTCRLQSTPGDSDPFTAAISVDEVRLGRLDSADGTDTDKFSAAEATSAEGSPRPPPRDDDEEHVTRKEVAVTGLSVRWAPGHAANVPDRNTSDSQTAEPVRGDTESASPLKGIDAVLEGVSVGGVLTVTAVGGSHGAVRHQFDLRASNNIAVCLTSAQVGSVSRHTARWSTRGAVGGGLFDPAPRAGRMTARERWKYAASRVLSGSSMSTMCWPAVRAFCEMRREYIDGLRASSMDHHVMRLELACSVQEVPHASHSPASTFLFNALGYHQQTRKYDRAHRPHLSYKHASTTEHTDLISLTNTQVRQSTQTSSLLHADRIIQYRRSRCFFIFFSFTCTC